ncbi:MAG: formylglycine-generating enzyme family protein [Nitrospinales bacterium]
MIPKLRSRFSRLLTFLIFEIITIGLAYLPVFSHSGDTGKKILDMALIPAGNFYQGSSEEMVDWAIGKFHAESREWYRDETPVYKVYLDDFFIDKNEVTVGQYKIYIKKTGKPKPKYFEDPNFNQDNQPVVGVSWQEAKDYCAWEGKRLPTESEWEKASRGPDAKIYPWGHQVDETKANVLGMNDKYRYPAPVGMFPQGQSLYGLMDMSGNVWEWTDSWYQPYPGNEQKNDLFGKKLKVTKGGSWAANMDLARSALRGKMLPEERQNYLGFRCAK